MIADLERFVIAGKNVGRKKAAARKIKRQRLPILSPATNLQRTVLPCSSISRAVINKKKENDDVKMPTIVRPLRNEKNPENNNLFLSLQTLPLGESYLRRRPGVLWGEGVELQKAKQIVK